jgi:hypothetical protein
LIPARTGWCAPGANSTSKYKGASAFSCRRQVPIDLSFIPRMLIIELQRSVPIEAFQIYQKYHSERN